MIRSPLFRKNGLSIYKHTIKPDEALELSVNVLTNMLFLTYAVYAKGTCNFYDEAGALHFSRTAGDTTDTSEVTLDRLQTLSIETDGGEAVLYCVNKPPGEVVRRTIHNLTDGDTLVTPTDATFLVTGRAVVDGETITGPIVVEGAGKKLDVLSHSFIIELS